MDGVEEGIVAEVEEVDFRTVVGMEEETFVAVDLPAIKDKTIETEIMAMIRGNMIVLIIDGLTMIMTAKETLTMPLPVTK